MSLTGLMGGQLLMGIRVVIDARQAATGARQVERSLLGIKKQALGTNDAVQKVTQNLAKSLQGIGVASTMVGAVALKAGHSMVHGFIKPSYEAAKEFNAALASMRIVTKSTQSEVMELGELMKTSSRGTMFDPTATAKSFTRLAAFTGDVKEAMRDLPALQDFLAASIGELEPVAASRVLSSTYEKFRAFVPDMRAAADIMITAANVSPFEFRDLPQFVRSMRDITVTANTSMEEVYALGGALRAVLSPAEAGRMLAALSSRMNQMGARVSEYAKKNAISFGEAMQSAHLDKGTQAFISATSEFGVEFFDRDTGKQKGFLDNITSLLERFDEIKKTTGDLDFQRLLFRLMGRQAATPVAALVSYERGGKKAADAARALMEQLKAAGGTAKWAKGVMQNSAEGIEMSFSAAAARMKIAFGDSFMVIFRPAIQTLTDFMERVAAFMTANPAIAHSIAILTTALAGFLLVTGTLTVAFGAAALWVSFLIPAIKNLGAVTAASSFSIKALGFSLLKIAGLFGILYGAYKMFVDHTGKATPKIGASFASLFNSLFLVSRGVAEWWTGKGGAGSKKLYDELKEKGLLGMVDSILNLKDRLVWFGKGFVFALLPAFQLVGGIVWGVLRAIELLIKGWEGAMSAFRSGTSDELDSARKTFQVLGVIVGISMYYKLTKLALAWGTVAKASLVAGLAGKAAVAPILLAIAAITSAVGLLHGTETGRRIGTSWHVGRWESRHNKAQDNVYEQKLRAISRNRHNMSKEEFDKRRSEVKKPEYSKAILSDPLIKANMQQDEKVAADAIRKHLATNFGNMDTSSLSNNALIQLASETDAALLTTGGVRKLKERIAENKAKAQEKEHQEVERNTTWLGGPRPENVAAPKNYTINITMDARGNNDGQTIADMLGKRLGEIFNRQSETSF